MLSCLIAPSGVFASGERGNKMTEEDKALQALVQQEVQRILADPRRAIRLYAEALQQSENELSGLKNVVHNELMPKVEMYDIAMGVEKLIEMSAVAKTLDFVGMGRNNLFAYLKDKGILRYNNEPYQQYVNAGYFKLVRQTWERAGYEGIYDKTMVTQKGVDYIGKLLLEDGYEYRKR